MEVKQYTVNDRRVEERVSRNELQDGHVEQVVETREEIIPMKVTRKVTQKLATVPVEERIETYGDDGAVNTTVKTVAADHLSLRQQDSVTLKDVVERLDGLIRATATAPATVSQEKNFLDLIKDAASRKNVVEAPNATAIPVKESNATEAAAAAVAWIAVVVLGGWLVYSVVM